MDFAKASMLLHVAEKSVLWPELAPLHAAALEELRRLQAGGPVAKPAAAPAPAPLRRETANG